MQDGTPLTLTELALELERTAIFYGDSPASDTASAEAKEAALTRLSEALSFVESILSAIRENRVVMEASGGETSHMRIRYALVDFDNYMAAITMESE